MIFNFFHSWMKLTVCLNLSRVQSSLAWEEYIWKTKGHPIVLVTSYYPAIFMDIISLAAKPFIDFVFICLTHWGRGTHIYMCHQSRPSLVQIMACRLFGAKPLSEPMLDYCKLDTCEHISTKFLSKYNNFHRRKRIWKCRLENGGHVVSASMC